MTSFNELNLPEALNKALAKMNFETPTPIQAQAIPVALEKRDLIGCAQTGTGKTAAFSLPILKHLLETKEGAALVLVPTRELAEQVWQVMGQLTQFAPAIRPAFIIGGVSMRTQIMALKRSPRVMIATPGRLVDHLGQRTVNLANIRHLVLDEADRMLDMGFAAQLEQILRHLPKERQTYLFSATMPPNIVALSKKYMNQPEQVTIGRTNVAAASVAQSAIKTTQDKKNDLLLDQVNARQGAILVFTRTKHRTEKVAKFLKSYGVSVERIHGGRSQAQRKAAIEDLKSGETRVLVATDIAARGIDVSAIEHVINYDLPQDPEDYIHRIGRTGRAGKSGEAVSFLTAADVGAWNAIQRLLNKDKPSQVSVPNRYVRGEGTYSNETRVERERSGHTARSNNGRHSGRTEQVDSLRQPKKGLKPKHNSGPRTAGFTAKRSSQPRRDFDRDFDSRKPRSPEADGERTPKKSSFRLFDRDEKKPQRQSAGSRDGDRQRTGGDERPRRSGGDQRPRRGGGGQGVRKRFGSSGGKPKRFQKWSGDGGQDRY